VKIIFLLSNGDWEVITDVDNGKVATSRRKENSKEKKRRNVI
jgi:hypothetical protein